jgi:hypothetical protein
VALATGIPFRAWLDEDDEVLATVLDIYDKRAAEAKRQRKKKG